VTPAKSDETLLDNPVWHALRSRLSGFRESEERGEAVRFDPGVSIFGAVDRLDESGWAALERLVGPRGHVALFRAGIKTTPEGWSELFRGRICQLVARDVPAPPELEVSRLGSDDAEEMVALTQLTEPGPFLPRTVELGTYIGIRRSGRLIAMAGQRFDLPGWTEISAVCTHPDARRQGLGAALTLWMARLIRERGDGAFLHVLEENESALRLYEALGFEVRIRSDVVSVCLGEPPAD